MTRASLSIPGVTLIVAALCVATPRTAVTHASPEVLKLAEEFRAFRSPVLRSRTWRPARLPKEVPDYAALSRQQLEGLAAFQARLKALSPRAWPIHDQIDYLLLRSEMDELDFQYRVQREPQTNPGFYIETAINGIAAEMRDVVPYSVQKAETIIAAFDRTAPIVEQAPRNLVLAESSADLARFGLRHIDGIRQKYSAGAKLMSPHFPETHRGRLAESADKAAAALEAYGAWIEANLSRMGGQAHIGRQNMDWYYKRINFVPWSYEELLFLGETEKNRFLMAVEIEKTKNKGLEPLTMPTTEEWIEWFRLTYLQTKYWLKDADLISIPPYVGESYLEAGTWQEPFGGIVERPGLMGFPTEPVKTPGTRLFVVPEDHWFIGTYWERSMRLDPGVNFGHSDWPGHYFETQVTTRNPCPIRATHRDNGFSQGWAFWFEEFFLDMGYPYLRGPRTRELVYNFLLLRAVRVPLGLYLNDGTLTMDEAVQYQIDRVPTMEPHISRVEVNAFVRNPFSAPSCTVGKRQLDQILADRIMQLGFRIDWREFHDSVLASGQIPLALVRWEMTGLDDEVKKLWEVPALTSSP